MSQKTSTQKVVLLDIYEFESERIYGMCEGEHGASILRKTGSKATLTVSELRQLKATRTAFYRLSDGTPYGPGGFSVYEDDPLHNIHWYILLEPDIDIY